MSETKHTKGPWICYADIPSTEPNWHIVTTQNKMRVLANVHIEPGNDVDQANAALITAAPDLLAVLKHLVRWHDQLSTADIAKAEAAIAKAEGRHD